MSTIQRIQTLARLLATTAVEMAMAAPATARINPSKPYKRRRLKMDPVSVLKRRVTVMEKRDPKIQRKRSLYRKLYNRKNKQLIKKRAEFVREAKKRLPPPPGHVAPKRST